MEGGCLGIEILTGEWPESGRKTPQKGWEGLLPWLERRRREEERENELGMDWVCFD